MNNQNTTGYKQVLVEISETRDVFGKLDDFFRKADENISNDPDDPRGGIGLFPGLDRLMLLIPCVIDRLEDDMSGLKDGANVEPITQGLHAIKTGINSVLTYYNFDDVGKAVNLLSSAALDIDKLVNLKDLPLVRFFKDLNRIAPDFHILLSSFEGFHENRRTRPKELEPDQSWSPECWLDYYLEQARLEEPLIAMVDAEGLSEASLEKGMELMINEGENRDKMNKKLFESYNLMKNRDAAFNEECPHDFLDIAEIPEAKDDENDDDYDVTAIDLQYYEEEDEPTEPWAGSLPELQNWNEHKFESDSSFDDSGFSRQNFRDDPVYQLLNPFVLDVFKCLKDDHLFRAKERDEESGEDRMRSPLDHYLIILSLKIQARIASCGVMAESVGHEASRKGVYMFAMECLERFADAIERFSQKHLYRLAREARNIKNQIAGI